jgi:rod shape-determining protein MreC
MLMAFDAREITSGQRVIRVWTQTAADFIQSPVTSVSSGLAGYFGSIANLRSAQDENQQFKQRVQELELELKGKEDLVNENERLRGLLALKEESSYKILPARVIGRDPSVWFESSIINRGSMDGVKLNMPIVTDGGLVGRVTAVGPLTAQVDLITHDKSGVGAIVGEISGSNALGVIGGTNKDVLEMRYVPGSVEVSLGQVVYTSGQDGIYPAGLRIGEIVDIKSGSATTPHVISVRSAGRIAAMQEVAVLLYEPPEKEAFDQKLPNALKDPKR